MKRLSLMVFAAAVASSAVYGAAATLGGLTTQDIAADSAEIIPCDNTGVRTQFAIAEATIGGASRSIVGAVTVDLIDDDCAGKELIVKLYNEPSIILMEQSLLLPAVWTTGTVDDREAQIFTSGGPNVKDVETVEVLINDPTSP